MRPSVTLVVFYIYFTAGANLLRETGVAAALGVSTQVTAGEKLAEASETITNMRGGGGLGETLLGLYTAAGDTFTAFTIGVTAGPRILVNVGIPLSFVLFLHAPLAIMVGRDIIYVVAGRDV